MSRNLLSGIIVTSVLVISLFFIFYFYRIENKTTKAINAIPANAAFIIECRNTSLFFKNLAHTDFWEQLQASPGINDFTNEMILLDSLMAGNEFFSAWKKDAYAYISFHPYANKKLDVLISVESRADIDMDKIHEWISATFPNRFQKNRRRFYNEFIYDYTDFKNKNNFSIASKNKVFLFSLNGALVEEALYRLKEGKPYEQSHLSKLNYVNNMGDASLYINYENLPLFIGAFANDTFTSGEFFRNFASWSDLSVNITDEAVTMKGASITNDSVFQFMDIFNSVTPAENTIKNILPSNTSYAFCMNYTGNSELFYTHVNEYLQVKKIYDNYHRSIDSMSVIYGNDLYKGFKPLMGTEAALILMNDPDIAYDSSYVGIVKTGNAAGLQKLITKCEAIYALKYGFDSAARLQSSFPQILPFHAGTFLKYFYADAFSGLNITNYANFGEYFLFANNEGVLHSFLTKNNAGQLLNKDPHYIKHREALTPTSNVELFIQTSKSFDVLNTLADEGFEENVNLYKGSYKKAEYISFQFSSTNEKTYLSNGQIYFNTQQNDKTELVWEVPLDTVIASDPQVVYNTAVNDDCIAVQDAANKLHLVSKEGKHLWSVDIGGKMLGKITEVDAFNNGKKQYIFNTDKYIYLLDENGKNIQGYPLWIPTGTNLPVSVFDFYNDKTYQVFVVGRFYKVWCYNIQAKLLGGWNPKNAWPNTTQQVRSFTFDKKPIIYLLNEKGKLDYYTTAGKKYKFSGLDSNARMRYVTHFSVDTSYTRFYSLDTMNNFEIKDVYLNKTQSKLKIPLPVSGRIALAEDVKVGEEYFIFKTKNKILVLDNHGKTQIELQYADSIAPPFTLIRMNNKFYAAYGDRERQLVNIIGTNATQYPDFPQEGMDGIGTGHLFRDADLYLITSGRNNRLLLYRVK